MSRGPRIVVAFIITLIIAAVVLKVTKAPPEDYIPPPHLYQNATILTHGWITGFTTTTYGEHLFEGSADFHFIDYKFQARHLSSPQYAALDTQDYSKWYTGLVRVDSNRVGPDAQDPYQVDQEITVAYDPWDPNINGVPGTMGVWSKTTGYMNPYLWSYVAFAAVVFLIQEIIRVATKTNDLGY